MKGYNMSNYQIGYSQNVIKTLQTRTALADAAFLLPYLKSNMKLLDCGCGPGNITIDLAKILKKGKVIGVDIEKSQLKIAEATARNKKIPNVNFQEGNILHLPFDDNSFDIVFTRATLYHLKNHKQAIKEMLRVTRPNGFIAACEPDNGAMLTYPTDPIMLEFQNLRTSELLKVGTDMILGRKLRSLFSKAGCKKTIGFAKSDPMGDYNSIRTFVDYIISELADAPFWKDLVVREVVSLNRIKEYQKSWKNFSKNRGAFLLLTWCAVIGTK